MKKILDKKVFLNESVECINEILIDLESKPILRLKDLDTSKTALVIVDMVNGFAKEGLLSSPRVNELISPITKLTKRCKELGIKIVAFADSHPENSQEFKSYPSHCLKGTIESEIVDELKEVGSYTLIEKNSTNGFVEEKYQAWLKENPEIINFIVVGDCTDICVLQYANSQKAYLNMKNMNSRVIVPIDQVDTYDLGVHKGDLLNVIALYIMQGNGIELISTIE